MCINQCALFPQYKGNISRPYIQIKNATPFGVAQQTTTLFMNTKLRIHIRFFRAFYYSRYSQQTYHNIPFQIHHNE